MIQLIFAVGLAFAGLFAQQTSPAIETDLQCQTCHQGNDWKMDAGLNFEHHTTGFQLQGMHAEAACIQCHPGSTPAAKHQFSNADPACNNCHDDIHQDQWGQDCQQCHTPDSWVLARDLQNHDLTRFPLQGAHQDLNCDNCHVTNPSSRSTLPIDCQGCHAATYAQTTRPAHAILGLSKDCTRCHPAVSDAWAPSEFNHLSTGFALIGMHAGAACAACHTSNAADAATDCQSCHANDYTASLDPPHAADGYPTACRQCHTSFNWQSSFSHDQTDFPLLGSHAATACSGCHVQQNFDDLADDCAGCHRNNWDESLAPPHADADFGLHCQDCHDESDWLPSSWTHDTDTDYPLGGAHIDVLCVDCHTTIPYADQATDCYACHQTDYENTLDPNHITAGIPTSCMTCHTTVNWSSEGIDHDLTQFPLLGAHVGVACETCHAAGYDLPTNCEGCHLANFQATSQSATAPDHVLFDFNTDCLECHNQAAWQPSSFEHSVNQTGYALAGAHVALLPNDCFTCHVDAQWSNIGQACETCHHDNFTTTSSPDHRAAGFPENLCETCHGQNTWQPSIFAHESTSEACQTCHLVQYNATTNPPHADLDFPTVCADCHTTNQWAPSTFTHDDQTTGFLLEGSHTSTACTACHTTWDPPTEVRTCSAASCHQANYDATTDPPHVASGFPLDCTQCHDTGAWSPSSFTHNLETTGFLVDGAHTEVACVTCHAAWDPVIVVRTCGASSCHEGHYQATENPPHALVSFATSCDDCHNTNTWTPSSFEHNQHNTGFPLSGAHTSPSCQQCHTPWQIPAQTRSCADASCHLTDYQNSTNPNHQSASFPLDCESCHSMTAWQPATFDHDGQYFPIYSGEHNNEWNNCSDCHNNSSDYGAFTCFGGGCHNVSSMNNEHCEGGSCESCNGFTYPSNGVTAENCYFCHPTGDKHDCGDDGLRFFKHKKTQPFDPSRLPDAFN